jgi:hypothetical protein
VLILLLILLAASPSLGADKSPKAIITHVSWSYDPSSRSGRAVIKLLNPGVSRIPSPRVAVVLLDPLGGQLGSVWGRPNGAWIKPKGTGVVNLTLSSPLIPSGVRVMLLDEGCSTCN